MFLFELAQCGNRTDSHDPRINSGRGYGQNTGERRELMCLDEAFTGENDGGRAVRDTRRVARRDRARLRKYRRQLRHFLERSPDEGMFILAECLRTFLAFEVDGYHFLLKPPASNCVRGASL